MARDQGQRDQRRRPTVVLVDPGAAWRHLAADAGHPLAGVPDLELAAGVTALLAAVRTHQEARRGAH